MPNSATATGFFYIEQRIMQYHQYLLHSSGLEFIWARHVSRLGQIQAIQAICDPVLPIPIASLLFANMFSAEN